MIISIKQFVLIDIKIFFKYHNFVKFIHEHTLIKIKLNIDENINTSTKKINGKINNMNKENMVHYRFEILIPLTILTQEHFQRE